MIPMHPPRVSACAVLDRLRRSASGRSKFVIGRTPARRYRKVKPVRYDTEGPAAGRGDAGRRAVLFARTGAWRFACAARGLESPERRNHPEVAQKGPP